MRRDNAIHFRARLPIRAPIRYSVNWPKNRQTSIRGRDLASGLPREIVLSSEEIRFAVAQPLTEIMAAIHSTLEETPPELAADITTEGILLAGGGSLLRGFETRVGHETGMPVRLADDPLACVATGAGMSLEELDTLPRGRRNRAD